MGIMGNMNGSLLDGIRYSGSTVYYGLGATGVSYSGSISTGLLSVARLDNNISLINNESRISTAVSTWLGSYLNHTPAVHNINNYSGGTYSPNSISTSTISGFYTGKDLSLNEFSDLAQAWTILHSSV